jgi:hypothetical protein
MSNSYLAVRVRTALAVLTLLGSACLDQFIASLKRQD